MALLLLNRVRDGGVVAVVAATASSGCCGGSQCVESAVLAMSVAVSVRVQKYGGLSVHPIGRTRGKATSFS